MNQGSPPTVTPAPVAAAVLPAWRREASEFSLPDVYRSIATPRAASFWRKLIAFSGPGFLVAVGYMDPGNWTTDLAGGARFGYALLSVVLISNFMAILLQHLSVKLGVATVGVATGRDLAQACRDYYSRPTVPVGKQTAKRRPKSAEAKRESSTTFPSPWIGPAQRNKVKEQPRPQAQPAESFRVRRRLFCSPRRLWRREIASACGGIGCLARFPRFTRAHSLGFLCSLGESAPRGQSCT